MSCFRGRYPVGETGAQMVAIEVVTGRGHRAPPAVFSHPPDPHGAEYVEAEQLYSCGSEAEAQARYPGDAVVLVDGRQERIDDVRQRQVGDPDVQGVADRSAADSVRSWIRIGNTTLVTAPPETVTVCTAHSRRKRGERQQRAPRHRPDGETTHVWLMGMRSV